MTLAFRRLIAAAWIAAGVVAPAVAQDRGQSEAMVEAGASALRRLAPAATAPDRGITPQVVAAAVYAAMTAAAWQPIETAPQDGTDMLFALVRNGEFRRGIGRWQVYDEPDKPGFWSVTEWFGAPPSHWMPLPPRN